MSKSLSEHILGLQEIGFGLVPGCQCLGLFGLHVFLPEDEIGTELRRDVFNAFLDGASTTHDSIKGVQAFVDGVSCIRNRVEGIINDVTLHHVTSHGNGCQDDDQIQNDAYLAIHACPLCVKA